MKVYKTPNNQLFNHSRKYKYSYLLYFILFLYLISYICAYNNLK